MSDTGISGKRRGLGTSEVLALIGSSGLALTGTAPADSTDAAAVGAASTAAKGDHTHRHTQKAVYSTGGNQALAPTDIGAEASANKGAVSGYAPLDASQQVPAANAPARAVYITGGAEALDPTSIGASDRWDNELAGSLQTTNATPGTCGTVTLADAKVSIVTATVAARRDTGAEGAGYIVVGAYRRSGGTVTLIGAVVQTFAQEDVAGWDATLVVSGTSVLVQVTGAASTIEWRSRVEVKVSP